MKIYNFRGEVNNRTVLIGLFHNLIEAIRMILLITFWLGLIFVPIILMVNHLIAKKTSDANFCPRLSSNELRVKYGCPIVPIAINK